MSTPSPSSPLPSPALEPLTLAHGPGWANRLALAPLTNRQSHPDGTLSDDEVRWLVARAEGGFGLVMTAAAHVAQAGKAWEGQLGISDDAHLPGLTRLAGELRAAGAVSSVQLHHAGQRADPAVSGEPLVAPWDKPERGVRALTTGEVEQVVEDFVVAAERAERAGFDGVEVHGAHGYLLCQFLDGRSNGPGARTDGYGGSLAERSRPLLEVLRGIRERCRPDLQVGLRLTPEGNGVTVPESVELAGQVLASGLVDYLDLSLWDVRRPDDTGEALLVDRYTGLERAGTRLGVAGKVYSGEDLRWCLERGVDYVSLGTAAILHHDLPHRLAADPDLPATPHPVTREHLRAQSVGPAFVDYLATGWDDFVSD